MKVALKGSQSVYHEGEIIPLEIAFTSKTYENFIIDMRGYAHDLVVLDYFCVDPAGSDPLEDYFESGVYTVWACCGLGGLQPWHTAPPVLNAELNEWQALKPGNYKLRIVSYRVGSPGESGLRGSIPVVSNTVSFQVVTASPEWQAEQLAHASSVLDAKHDLLTSAEFEEIQHAMRVLRFLGSEAATRELARRFWFHDQPRQPPQLEHPAPYPDYDQFRLDTSLWDFKFGLIGSPHHEVAIQELASAINDPRHPATRQMVETLALLEIQSKPEYDRLMPYDGIQPDERGKRQRAKRAAYDQIVDALSKQVASKR
jgi:hypothetical protein